MDEVMQGSTFSLLVSFRDADDEPVDLTDATVTAVLSLTKDEDSPTVTVSSTDDPNPVDFSAAASGQLTVKYRGELTEELVIQDFQEVFLQVRAVDSAGDQHMSSVVTLKMLESIM